MRISENDTLNPDSKGFYWVEEDTLFLPNHLSVSQKEELVEKWEKQIRRTK